MESPDSQRRAFCVAVVVATMVGLILLLAQRQHGNTDKLKSRELDKHCTQCPRKFSYAILRAATKNFSNDQMLGKGGFGQVYGGILSASKETVAVKRISQGSKQEQKEYISEVSIISKLRHRNLVQLHGWCHEKGRLLLVYKFLPNGSLDRYLFGEQKKDAKLGRNFNGEEMERVLLVGLLCSHPDPKARLSTRQVVDILKIKAPLPPLPPTYPEIMYTTSHSPVGTFCTAERASRIESA
ncbi:L-type lectin-domain containing receptor kinase IX.1-like [Cryptomeria japonica]|uniref:L-type lectin-domain containing receptor kinase IX.1-like n=1 Tax=Cryptomeria japonica TaxID=3369 RepID=UPI0027DA2DD8|nr:L-type lectin-domain containing receptor kinase IX.1-like [Cryptomeria japonica]